VGCGGLFFGLWGVGVFDRVVDFGLLSGWVVLWVVFGCWGGVVVGGLVVVGGVRGVVVGVVCFVAGWGLGCQLVTGCVLLVLPACRAAVCWCRFLALILVVGILVVRMGWSLAILVWWGRFGCVVLGGLWGCIGCCGYVNRCGIGGVGGGCLVIGWGSLGWVFLRLGGVCDGCAGFGLSCRCWVGLVCLCWSVFVLVRWLLCFGWGGWWVLCVRFVCACFSGFDGGVGWLVGVGGVFLDVVFFVGCLCGGVRRRVFGAFFDGRLLRWFVGCFGVGLVVGGVCFSRLGVLWCVRVCVFGALFFFGGEVCGGGGGASGVVCV